MTRNRLTTIVGALSLGALAAIGCKSSENKEGGAAAGTEEKKSCSGKTEGGEAKKACSGEGEKKSCSGGQ